MNQLITKDNREQSKAESLAVKADYKKWKGDLSYNDLANYLKKCYNDYNDYSNDLTLPRDVRNSYGDRAFTFKAVLAYIERQAK